MRDGSPAFPSGVDLYRGTFGTQDGERGMSLRDYFAAKVLSQCQIHVRLNQEMPTLQEIELAAVRVARTAYVMADAMLAQRERPLQEAVMSEPNEQANETEQTQEVEQKQAEDNGGADQPAAPQGDGDPAPAGE